MTNLIKTLQDLFRNVTFKTYFKDKLMDIKNVNTKTVNYCPCCNKTMHEAINLPKFPLTEFYEEFDKNKFEDKGYLDQKLLFCSECSHASLEKIIDVEYVYSNDNYLTTTAGSFGAIQCLDNFYNFIKKNTKKLNYKNIIDIGGNDGYLLKLFPEEIKKINIDPNAIKSDGVEHFNMFFENLDFKTLSAFDKKLIVSSHTFEHVASPVKLIGDISHLLNEGEMFIIQLPSIEKMIEHQKFEQLCHQHLNYFSKKSLIKVFNSFGLEIVDIDYDETHFGTIRVAGVKRKNVCLSIVELHKLSLEDIKESFNNYKNYMSVINNNILSSKGIEGFGAGLMVPVLAYFLPALKELNCIYDENAFKQGKRFINLNVVIKPPPKNNDFSHKDILITSVTTKSAARAIFKKLTESGVKNLICPVIYL
jgi:hypothetical protein